MKKFAWAAFAGYIAVMLWLLFARESLDTGGEYWGQVGQNLNLRPLVTICHQWRLLHMDMAWAQHSGVINIYGNVLVFVPLGLGLPALVGWLRKLWRTLAFSALVITAVEIAQLLTLRGFGDVDDLLLNLVGVAMGYGLYRLMGGSKGRMNREE